MRLICPECKNDVDLSSFQEVSPNIVLECQMCGISLVITSVDGEMAFADIIDEGK